MYSCYIYRIATWDHGIYVRRTARGWVQNTETRARTTRASSSRISRTNPPLSSSSVFGDNLVDACLTPLPGCVGPHTPLRVSNEATPTFSHCTRGRPKDYIDETSSSSHRPWHPVSRTLMSPGGANALKMSTVQRDPACPSPEFINESDGGGARGGKVLLNQAIDTFC